MRRMMKANPALAPLIVLGSDVLGHKNDVAAPANELVFFGVGLRSNESKDRSAIRGSNRYPAITGFHAGINDQTEPKLVQVESQASILIANQDRNVVQTEMELLSSQAIDGLVRPRG